MHPLYRPRVALQLGQLCFTSLKLSTQKGTQKQGQSMVKQSAQEAAQAIMLGRLSVVVLTVA